MQDSATGKRLAELFKRSRDAGYYLFTDFLGLGELSTLKSLQREGYGVCVTLFGGAVGCERVIARFGSPDELGYEDPFPIATLKITPKSQKYAEALTHRDYLGSILALGIERDVVGDIIRSESEAYVFVKEEMSEYIKSSLSRIRHTDVTVSEVSDISIDSLRKTKRVRVQAESERADGIVAKVFSISREAASGLFAKGLVFSDGIEISGKTLLANGACVSVRGHGRFIYLGYETLSRKGKLNIDVEVFV